MQVIDINHHWQGVGIGWMPKRSLSESEAYVWRCKQLIQLNGICASMALALKRSLRGRQATDVLDITLPHRPTLLLLQGGRQE